MPRSFIPAIGRNPGEEHNRAHMYEELPHGDLLPMCRRGWNRCDGAGFSVARGVIGTAGICKSCEKRIELDLPPVESVAGSHSTK